MNLLITGAWKCNENQISMLEAAGYSCIFMQDEKEKLPCDARNVEGIICNGLFLHHNIEDFKSLKFIQLTSAGFDRVPMAYAQANGITVFNAKNVYSVPMAEYALSGVLCLYKKLNFFKKNQEKRLWEKNRDVLELFKKTVTVVGTGSVGTECAKRFKAFGCTVLGIDIQEKEDESFNAIYGISRLSCAVAKSDIVVLALPLTESTFHIIDKEILSLIKKGGILVNISRGAVVDEGALINALDDNLGGAVLDVFEKEPLTEQSELWNKENVILTPHNSFVGENNQERLWEVIYKNLKSIGK